MKKMGIIMLLIGTLFVSGCSSIEQKKETTDYTQKIKETQAKFTPAKVLLNSAYNEYIDKEVISKDNLVFTIMTGFGADFAVSDESTERLTSFYINEQGKRHAYVVQRKDYKDYLEKKISLKDVMDRIGEIQEDKANTLYYLLAAFEAKTKE